MYAFWFAMFLSWLLKWALIRIGGLKLNQKAMPFFVGLLGWFSVLPIFALLLDSGIVRWRSLFRLGYFSAVRRSQRRRRVDVGVLLRTKLRAYRPDRYRAELEAAGVSHPWSRKRDRTPGGRVDPDRMGLDVLIPADIPEL
jgi:hypothetical protein